MQWAPLNSDPESTEPFYNLSPFNTPENGPLFGGRPTLFIPKSDLSGNLQYEINRNQLLDLEIQKFNDNPLHMNMRDLLHDFKALKSQSECIKNEITIYESQYKQIKEAQKELTESLLHVKSNIGYLGLLPVEKVNTILKLSSDLESEVASANRELYSVIQNQIAKLEVKLMTTQDIFGKYREFIKTGVKELVGPDVKTTSCSICWENDIAECLVPCGHTFCSSCINKATSKQCMTCRSPYTNNVKIFM